MYSSFKGPANVRDKQPVFEAFGERQFTNFDDTKHAPAPVWNVHSQPYNNVRIYPGDQLNIKLQTLTAHNQTVIPEQRSNVHSNSLQCPYPNNSQTVVRPTAVINCHSNGTSCCGHPNRVPHHWNTVPPNVPPPRHFVDNVSLYNNHSNLNSEDYRFRTDPYYAPINKQPLSHRDNPAVSQPSFYPGPLRSVQGLTPVYDVKLPAPLPVTNRGKYAGNKVPRSEPCAKCSGNCSENCELYGGQDIVDFSSADTPNEFVRENVACYPGLHPEAAGPTAQFCAQWATNTTSQAEYCRQNNNAAMWVHNPHSAVGGNNLASNCWMDKKELLSGNFLSQYASHHPSATQQNTRAKDTPDTLKLPEVSCMQPPQLINGYPEVLHQDKDKVYNGNFCNHVPGRRIDETQNKINGPYFKEREVIHPQTVPQFSHVKQIKHHDFSLNGAPSMPQERVIFQESQTFTSTIGSHPISVPPFAQPNVIHPYNKNTTKSCFQNSGSGQLHAQDVTANSFSLSKVTEAFTTGIAQPPSRFSSHLTYTQSRISKANNDFGYFQDYDSSGNLGPHAGTSNPAVANALSPKMNPVTPTCVSDSHPTFSSSDDSTIVTNALHPASRNEHNFNRNTEYSISDLQSCKRLQENNITGKLMQVIDASTSNVNIGIRECTDISSNDASNVMVKNISSYSNEYNIYSGNIPPGSGSVSFNSSTANVAFPGTQLLTNFDPYGKQFGHGAGAGPDVLSSSGPIMSSVGESEVAGSDKVIQPDFGTEKFYEATASPQIKRDLPHVSDIIKSEYRTLHSVKQKGQKVGQLDVRQFLATWDEETEDVASPRLPDVVLSSNGTPLYVVECGGGNLSEISPVATNSTNEGTVQRNGVIVYEHIQPINTDNSVTEHTHADHLSNRNADGLQVNVTDDTGALENSDCILLGSHISESETVQSNQGTNDSNTDVKQHVQKNILALTDGHANKEGNSVSPEGKTESILPNPDSPNTATTERLCPIIFSKESVSDLQSVVNSEDKCLLVEKANISTTTIENNEEKQSCDDVQGTSASFLQKTDSVPRGINYDSKDVSRGPLCERLQDENEVKNDESDLHSEAPSGTKHSNDEVVISSRNSNLDDIAVDAFEKLTNGKGDESALKCRYNFSDGSARININDDGGDLYLNSPQCDSKSEVIEATENQNDVGRSKLYIENISTHNSASDKNIFVDKCTHAKNLVTDGCVKETILETSFQNQYPINYRTFECTLEMRNKRIMQCYDEVPQCHSDKMVYFNTATQSDSNISVKSSTKCDHETVSLRHKREINGSCKNSFVTDKYECLERNLSVHNPFSPLEIPKRIGKLPLKSMSVEKKSVLSVSNKLAVLNRRWQNSGKLVGNIPSDFSRVGVAHLSSNAISARTATMNEVISVSCKCLFSNQSVSDSIFTRSGTKSFLLPVDFLLDRATMYLIRKRLFSGKHPKTRIKGTLDSSRTRFLTNDKTLSRRDVLKRSTEYSHLLQMWNERAHGSGQVNARFSFASIAASDPEEKVQCGNRYVTTFFEDSDESRLSLFLKQYFQDDDQGNYNRIVESLKLLMQQSGKGRSFCGRLFFRPTASVENDEEPGAQVICNISDYRNLPGISNLPLLSINSDVFRDECIPGQSGVLQNLETASISFKISDSCVSLWFNHLGYKDYTHSCKNLASITFQDAPMSEESSACTYDERNVSKFEATSFSRYDLIGKELFQNIQTVTKTCKASTTTSQMLLIQDHLCGSNEISYVHDKKVNSNNSVNGYDDQLTALLSIKNNDFGGNYQLFLSKYLFKILRFHRIDTVSNSRIIRKLNDDSAEQEDCHQNAKSVSQEGSSIPSRQVITELTSHDQELVPLKSVFRKVEEENSLLSNKAICNGVSHTEKAKNCFVMETTSHNSIVNDAVSGDVKPVLPYSKNIMTKKCPVPIHDDAADALHNSDSAVTPNSRLTLNEMCSRSEQQVSVVSPHNTNRVTSKTQNSKLELADESEVVISSTSTLEEANADVDCDFNNKAGSLFLFEDELPCVESYVDADDVTVVSGTHDDILDEENDIDVPCVVVYPETHENVLQSEENVGTHISSIDICSESNAITTAIISDDVCMNSNCVIISEDESPRQSPQNLLMDIVPCSSQEDTLEFRRFSTECTDEYQNSTVSSTTHINELADSNRLKSMTTVLLREDQENQNITTSDMHGDFSFFGEEVDYYNTGVLQADSVSDWPYLEEEVISELQNSDVEPEVPLGNTTCEINSDKINSLSCSPTTINNLSVKNDAQCQNLNVEESSSCSKRKSAEENYTQDNNEIIDLKCRLSWDKIFNLSRKDNYSGCKVKNRTRKTVTKSWPYYCKTQSRWKWPKSKDKLYRKLSKKPKEISIFPEGNTQKGDCIGQGLEKDAKKISGTLQIGKTDTGMHVSPTNTSSLKHNMWQVTNGNSSTSCGYKREKNNNYVIESIDSNSKSDVLSNPIVLVQRLILKRNRDHSDHGAKTTVDKKAAFSGHVCNVGEKASCSNPYKQGICKSETLGIENSTDVYTHRDERDFVEIRENQEITKDSCSSGITKCYDNNNKNFDMFKAGSISSRKKAKSISVEAQHLKPSKEVKRANDKSVKKNSDERHKELPRVIIKRSPDGSTRYKSFLCLSAATEKYWQPVVMLKRDSNIEELAKRMQKRKLSSRVVDGSSQSNLEIPSDITGKAHKIKYKDSMHATVNKNSGKELEWGAVDTCIGSQKKIIRRQENGDFSDFKYSKCSDTNSLSVNSCEPFHNTAEANNVPGEQKELRCGSVSNTVPTKSGKKYKGMIKHGKNFEDERGKDCKRIHSESQELLSLPELPSRKQSIQTFSDSGGTDVAVSTLGEENYKHYSSRCESKHNYHESNNEENHYMHCSSSRDKILKKNFQEQQKSEKNSRKRHSERTDSKSAKRKKCFWDRDYTKSVQVASRSQQKCTNITVLSNKESHFPAHRRDEMTTSNARCSLIDRQVSLQKDELEADKTADCNPVDQDGGKIDCQACGLELKNFAERSSHIRQHPYHCQRCHLAFKSEGDFVNHLSVEHPQTKEQHHCLLCEKSFATSDKHQMHLQGKLHRYVELTQRRTIHTIFTLLTGKACPGLPPLTDSEMEGLGWFPSEPGTVHFYHQATPLQMAVQGWLNCQRNKSECGSIEENKRSEFKDHSQ